MLDRITKKFYKIPERVVAAMAWQIATGLNYLHEMKRSIHRDIKPANILVNSDWTVKVWDFGLARSYSRLNQEYSNLFNSIEMEKILYSIIWIIIIIISNFTFLISLSSLILNKIKQFGILQAIGYSNKLLSTLIFIYSLVLNSISLLIGISLSYLIVYLNDIYDFVGLIFNNSLLFNMNYHISYYNIIFILLFTFLSIFLSSIYPVKLLINLNLKNKIHYIKWAF